MAAAPPPAPAFRLEPYDYAEARALMLELDLTEPVAVTLVRRGYRTAPAARAFLDAADAHDPFAFAGMAAACERIEAAIGTGRRITVHGDYDVDGVCATAIAVRALRERGAECDWVIPDRLSDGYGLTVATVESLRRRGTGLLITVDCGIGSVEEIAAARAAGIDVIVTDHHQPGDELPDCPILHPVVSGYPCAELCATGVSYKLATALLGADAVARELDLVALATVADLVPLRGENRALVRRGLAEARRASRPGLRALMASAGVRPERLDEGDLAFRLGPRINAAGRLYRADAGVELMLTADIERAQAIATELERANAERRAVEEEVVRGAERARAELDPELADAPGLVLAGRGWHPGVVGIAASRLAERLWRPVVLIGLDEAGRGRGSGRSVPGFDLLAALDACAEHLTRYGGHRAAAGLELDADRIDAFRRRFAEVVAETIPAEALTPVESVDAVVGGESLGYDVAEQLARLGPFGQGNPGVRLLVAGARLSDVRPMGEAERHARFSLRSGRRLARGVAFGVDGELAAAAEAGPLDLGVRLELNEWNGAIEPRVVLDRIYAEELETDAGERVEDPALDEGEFWGRFDAELALDLSGWPPALARGRGDGSREAVDRRGASIIAALAALASGGETVLVLCADALRRRELVQTAVRPARFGGGTVAIAAGQGPRAALRGARDAVVAARSGVVLTDWTALAAQPLLAADFRHVAVVDPPPFAHLDALVRASPGYLHLLADPAATEFALQVHADEWPSRDSLAFCFRGLRRAVDAGDGVELDAAAARIALCGPGRTHPRSPEAAARLARVLGELGLLRWDGSGAVRTLGVVSSETTNLDGSSAFVAYRERYEDGRRFLTERGQTN